MKAFGKELFSLQPDPILRGLFAVFVTALLVAGVFVIIGFILFH